MMHESRKTVVAYEVRPGLRMPLHTNKSDVNFMETVVCEQSHPTEVWHGEVGMAGRTILTTAQF